MVQLNFEAQVDAQIAGAMEKLRLIRNEAAERVVDAMQTPVADGGNMPVKSGWLRGTLAGGVGDVNFTMKPNPNPSGQFSYDASGVNLVIASASLSDTISVAYTAVYARIANYGGENREPRLFVDLAAQRWPAIVREVEALAVERRVG